ncbi:MAG TPA: hypothetical protein VFW62_04515 [bacterium]|nr:hypothetical protein [bacterium]
MKVTQPYSLVLIATLLFCLGACVGGGALEGGGPGGSIGEVGQGQGQPTIQPGADHQPGTPIEPEDEKSASDDLAIPPPPPTEEPDPGHGGATDLTY